MRERGRGDEVVVVVVVVGEGVVVVVVGGGVEEEEEEEEGALEVGVGVLVSPSPPLVLSSIPQSPSASRAAFTSATG